MAWTLGILVIDQAAKWAVASSIGIGESVGILGRLVRITHVTNPGAAFGLFRGRRELFVVATALVLAMAVVMAARLGRPGRRAMAGLGLAAGGAAGNLVDRLRTGAVVDFIDVSIFPVFNVADVAIIGGVALLFWHLIRRSASPVPAESDTRTQ